MRWLLVALVLGLLLPSVNAATILGDVYQFDLTPAKDVVIAIDTVPRQQVVATNGSYSVNVPAGHYTLTAVQKQAGVVKAQVSENITVASEGSYTLDLILFPEIDTNDDLNVDLNFSGTDTEVTPTSDTPLYIIGGAVVVLVAILWLVMRRKTTPKTPETETRPSDTELDDLVASIKKLGGRATQKELRKQLPHSEAKVSLMLTELEHKGVITKIKRGRANVIVLK